MAYGWFLFEVLDKGFLLAHEPIELFYAVTE